MYGGVQSRRLLLAAALAAMLVLAGCSGSAGPTETAESYSSPTAGPGGDGGEGQRASYYDASERVIVRSADMEVRVKDVGKQFRQARAAARARGGFVTDYTVESEGDWQRATFTVRVLARNFSETRDALADLGTLESEQVRARDFTNEHQQREGKLAQLRERERNLQRELNRTDDEHERERVREELRDVRDRIDELQAKQAELERREALSTIRVTMHEPVAAKPPANYESSWGFGDSLLAGIYGGATVLKGVVVVTGYLLSMGLAALVLGLLVMVFYATTLAVYQRLWPRLRDGFGLESPSSDRPDPRPDLDAQTDGGGEERGGGGAGSDDGSS